MGAFGRRNFSAYPSSHFLYRNNTNQTTATNNTKESIQYCSSRTKLVFFLICTVCYTWFLYQRGGAGSYLKSRYISNVDKLRIATWNVAAINNNPFEYWVEDNPEYVDLMSKIEDYILNPDEVDVSVESIFSNEMYNTLEEKMNSVGWPSVAKYWNNDLRHRTIISGYLKDDLLGSKRLASMPDRVTNTINVVDSKQAVYRPTVINMYDGDLNNIEQWFDAWMAFMFDNSLTLKNEKKIPYQMLLPISKAKYPDITEEEEEVSLPLQTLCGAIFDSILVHMMNTVSEPNVWQPLKRKMVDSFFNKKQQKTLFILESKTYINSDIIMIEEASTAFIELASSSKLGKKFFIVSPKDMDSSRDQNSVILLNKGMFPNGVHSEITSLVKSNFPNDKKVPVSNGDLLVITAIDKFKKPYVIASFHGDTNGLATIPVLGAIVLTLNEHFQNHNLLFGLDANTYEKAQPNKKQDVTGFATYYKSLGLDSCWGDFYLNNYTTYNARTYLQPQLNKACKSNEKRTCGDVNPKDFILFSSNDFQLVHTWKDNTGNKEYTENMAFPTSNFPSDHGIVSTIIQPL